MQENPGVLVIVEDDADLLEGWTDLFEFSGYEVLGYQSGAAALADAEAMIRADLLITDYHLADLNGVGVIRAARRIKPGLPAAVLTGLKQDHVVKNVEGEPDVTLFFKPTSMEEIEGYVERTLARVRAAG